MRWFYIISLIILTACMSSNDDNNSNNTAVYFVNLPDSLDTIEFKTAITLNQTNKIHKLKLPNGGTETNVSIYDSTYISHIQNDTNTEMQPLVNGNFKSDKEVLLDITALPRGKYYVHYLSCNLGGIFTLTIN